MRYAELLFLALLVAYHVVLLLPRHKRPFPANYLVFLAGMALAWSLGMEGLRWQNLPPLALLLVDLAVLFPTFSTLRGTLSTRSWLTVLGSTLRFFVVFVALALAVGSALLAVAFPLPRVELTGGTPPSQRVVRFPPTPATPGLEVRIWYPASGDLRPQPRTLATAEIWQERREAGALPVFWQAYWEHLPTGNILGGRLAVPKTKYPVIFVVVPPGQPAYEFGYLLEDLASRGFVVASAGPLPPPPAPVPPFGWSAAGAELARPFSDPLMWLQPELKDEAGGEVPDGRWLRWGHQALEQLSREPGDALYGGLDWSHQGLWVWGSDVGLEDKDLEDLGIKAVIRAGVTPPADGSGRLLELWVSPQPPTPTGPAGRWVLTWPGMHRADLTDAAYLKPYLALAGLKSQADAGFHGVVRQYQAAFFQYAFWSTGDGSTFGQTVPQVPGLVLSGR